MIGFSGAHRTGKTTLAMEASKVTKFPFLKIDTSSVFKRAGVDPAGRMAFDNRLKLQWDVLENMVDQIMSAPCYSITDRTPLDCLAYLLSFLPHDLSDEIEEEVESYAYGCFSATNQIFDLAILVPPTIPLMKDETKATGIMSVAHRDRLSHLVSGIMKDRRCRVRTETELLNVIYDPIDRIQAVKKLIFEATWAQPA